MKEKWALGIGETSESMIWETNLERDGLLCLKSDRISPRTYEWNMYFVFRIFGIEIWRFDHSELRIWETFSRSTNSGIIFHTTTWECRHGKKVYKASQGDGFNMKNEQLTSFLRLDLQVYWVPSRIKRQKCGSIQNEEVCKPSNLLRRQQKPVLLRPLL